MPIAGSFGRRALSAWCARGRAAAILVAAPLFGGCGGGLPLLHPARPLGMGEVRASGGFSGQFATVGLAGTLRDAVDEARSLGTSATSPNADVTLARGALIAASVAPGIAPLVGARVGLGYEAEAGLAYTGRAVRADIRRALALSAHWTASLGVGGSAVLYGRQQGDGLPNVDLSHVHGWGADVPLLVGYESDGGLYSLWLGARGGWEHVDADTLTSEPGSVQFSSPLSLSSTEWWGGGLVGLAVGFRHVHVALEVDAAYVGLSGEFESRHADVAGMTVAPAGALWWAF